MSLQLIQEYHHKVQEILQVLILDLWSILLNTNRNM
jgi:hypothetical protein